MVEPNEARTALDEVRSRQRQVRTELARQRPVWWSTLLLTAGYYLALATLDLPFPVPLIGFAGGAALFLAGHLAQSRRQANGPVRPRPDTFWRPRHLTLTAVWLVALAAAYALPRLVLLPVVPEGVTSILAAVPSALLFAAMAGWQYAAVYGSPRTAATGSLGNGAPGTEHPAR
ncbi:hypothetical protein [Plantactinospora sonchi]|uniref:Transmembrane protein n=1 Tax=Plantactinospora sonchi TaxID=1544735 RepID=A0ABU7RTI7_9ACTN